MDDNTRTRTGNWEKVDPISFPTSQQIRAKAAEYIPQLEQVGEYQPQTKFGEYIQTGLEFATLVLQARLKQQEGLVLV